MNKCEEALDLLLKQDADGFSLALHMGGFKDELSFSNIKKWLATVGEDDWDIKILIEDLKSNLSPGCAPQIYLVKDRKTVVVPVFKFGLPDFGTEEAFDGISAKEHFKLVNLLGGFLVSMFNNTTEMSSETLARARDKKFISESLEALRVFNSPFSDKVKNLIDKLCDDTTDEEGEVPALLYRGLLPHKNKAIIFCTPIVSSNGDLSISFTLSI